MTGFTDTPITAPRPKRRSFWLIDFLLSPFTDTDERAYHMKIAQRAARTAGAPVAFKTATVPGYARPPLRRFPRDGG